MLYPIGGRLYPGGGMPYCGALCKATRVPCEPICSRLKECSRRPAAEGRCCESTDKKALETLFSLPTQRSWINLYLTWFLSRAKELCTLLSGRQMC